MKKVLVFLLMQMRKYSKVGKSVRQVHINLMTELILKFKVYKFQV